MADRGVAVVAERTWAEVTAEVTSEGKLAVTGVESFSSFGLLLRVGAMVYRYGDVPVVVVAVVE